MDGVLGSPNDPRVTGNTRVGFAHGSGALTRRVIGLASAPPGESITWAAEVVGLVAELSSDPAQQTRSRTENEYQRRRA